MKGIITFLGSIIKAMTSGILNSLGLLGTASTFLGKFIAIFTNWPAEFYALVITLVSLVTLVIVLNILRDIF